MSAADVYSVTSFTELRREAMAIRAVPTRRERNVKPIMDRTAVCRERNAGHRGQRLCRGCSRLDPPWVRDRYVTLGTDGFGRSDTRAALREFFEVDRRSIALAALDALE